MTVLLDWIDSLMQLARAFQISDVVAIDRDDMSAVLVLLYPLAAVWLIHRYHARREWLALALAVAAGMFRLLAAVVLLVFGLVFAVARAAGRSTFYTRSRF